MQQLQLDARGKASADLRAFSHLLSPFDHALLQVVGLEAGREGSGWSGAGGGCLCLILRLRLLGGGRGRVHGLVAHARRVAHVDRAAVVSMLLLVLLLLLLLLLLRGCCCVCGCLFRLIAPREMDRDRRLSSPLSLSDSLALRCAGSFLWKRATRWTDAAMSPWLSPLLSPSRMAIVSPRCKLFNSSPRRPRVSLVPMPSAWLSFFFTFLFLLLVIAVITLALVALAPGREEDTPPPPLPLAPLGPRRHALHWSALPPPLTLQYQPHQPLAFQPHSQLPQAHAQAAPQAAPQTALQVPPADALEQPSAIEAGQQQQAAPFQSQQSSLLQPSSLAPVTLSTAATDSAAHAAGCELCVLSAPPTATVAKHSHEPNPRLTPEEHKQLTPPRSPSISPVAVVTDSWAQQQEQLRLYSARIVHIHSLEAARRQTDWQLSPQIDKEASKTSSTASRANQQAERKGQDA